MSNTAQTSAAPALPTVAQVAQLIDHAILKPEFTRSEVDAQLDQAARYRVFSVCVRPSDIGHAVEQLAGTGVLVGTVIGFPHGTTSTGAKVAESKQAIADGAAELDMVVNIGWLRSGMLDEVEADIRGVVDAADGRIVKVILETVFLTDEQIAAGSAAAARAGASFVKTSTGFNGGGANVHDLVIMRDSVPPTVKVKASGGVRGLDTLLEMLALGVSRFGTSASSTILDDLEARITSGTATGAGDDATSY
jgi:deoxyribose-phosphate aldolase